MEAGRGGDRGALWIATQVFNWRAETVLFGMTECLGDPEGKPTKIRVAALLGEGEGDG